MTLTPDSIVADIATATPGTIPVFQQFDIDFCCGGRASLQDACRTRGLDVDTVLDGLRAAVAPAPTEPNWATTSLSALAGHIQQRYHEPLRAELPRLDAMLDKVVTRHGNHLPKTLLPLQQRFQAFATELLDHMDKEDQRLFPGIVALESGTGVPVRDLAAWIASPIGVMEAEHERAGDALASIREITNGFAPPDWACPTFRGLYYGLAQLETDMHVHVHLENNILFPRAMALARTASSQ